ncbi:MAG: alpha/beta hydrolase-fold protein [Paludibacter sp.]|nr:alpha/beta hydrolase-fold protein [Paludibacter sp.]
MKRIHLLIIAVGVRSKLLFLFVLFITQNIFSLTYNVTVPTGTKACYFAGEIIGWSHQAMTKVDETHYTISFANANPTQPYKYCSGPDWGYEELDAAGVPIANRTYNVADVVIKWRAVYEPGAVVTQIANTLKVSSGTVVRYSFNSTFIGARTVDVWLPAGYSASKKYAVLYMHDGQMLFDATSTWNGQEWKVDETLAQLMSSGEIKDVVVVGIWNSSNRYAEYYPEKSMDYLLANIKTAKSAEMNNDPKADEYLKFIVDEVKPFVDKTYSVNTDASNTCVAGSSMGGLISWYAMCEYPAVFGSAICMSTHWGVLNTDDASIPDSFRKYLLSKLPSPTTHAIYFDHGTIGLDANYPQNQALADTIVRFKGYTATNWKTQVFTGDDHNETCWANRFSIPVKFIIPKNIINKSLILNTDQLNGKGILYNTTVPVSWTSSSVQNIKIEYSVNNGTNWNLIAASVPASQLTYNWTTPSYTTTTALIRISDASDNSVSSVSSVFTIAPAITNISFSVDASVLISENKFNPATDKLYIRGSFNNYELTHRLKAGNNNIYSLTIPLASKIYIDYKYFSTAVNADNTGWENNFPASYNGNRHISFGTNNLTLATVYYNDVDMNLSKTSDHFTVIYNVQDQNAIDYFLQRMEILHKIVSEALQVTPTEKTTIYMYKDLAHLHLAQGYPENPDWSTGSAYGKNLLIMLSPAKMGMNDALGLCAHEYTHCLNATKTKVTLPAWLNEGVACYFGRNFSTKDWIKSVMDVKGKPDIATVFDTDMGYAYSSIVAYYIIKTKGMAAMAKFVENMNYADIGYANLAALQTAWHAFLDTYLNTQTSVNVKFSVNMADMIASKFFIPGADKVYVKGDEYGLGTKEMTLESGTIYSVTIPVNTYSLNEYKFYTNSATAPNNGLELNTDETVSGYRLLDITNSAVTLSAVTFNSSAMAAIQGVDMAKIYNKIEVLRYHGKIWNNPAFSAFKYSFKLLSATEYQSQKPTDAFAFDAGFVATDGTINISEPTTTEQKAVFANTTQVAVYYLCQSYMYYFYQTRNLPLLFKVGFPVFEAGILPNDATIKTAVNAYGGSFSSFDVLNNRTTFISNNGLAIAGAFAEFMSIFKNWGYPNVTTINASGFDVMNGWWNVDDLAGLLADFNRYTYHRFLQPDENLRIKLYKETDHVKFYTRPVDGALNFPSFANWTETAYNNYVTNFKVQHGEKISFFTLPSCIDGDLEGKPCNGLPPERLTGGTAWSSGVHSTCASKAEEVVYFEGMCEHELAHSFQGIFPQGTVTAWLNEGFPSFCSDDPITDEKLVQLRQSGIDCMTAAQKYFGHRPTYEETRIYPSPDYGYYTLGYFFIDYQYRKGGYPLIKAIQMNDVAAYQSLGYATAQAFLEDFYFDFDVRVQQLPIATLINPLADKDETNSTVNISWTPLKADIKLNVSVSVDDAKTWTEVVNRTTGTSCVWNSGSLSTRFYIKISAPDNLNVSTTYGPFIKTDLTKINIISPTLNNYVISGDSTAIKWASTGIQNIKIDYSLNNGANWTTITNNTSTAANIYNWIVPTEISGSCKLRLTDITNNANYSQGDAFTIVKPNEVGGPYLYDKNTLLLLHFDNDLNNRSKAAPNAVGDILNLTSEASTISNLGLSYKNSSSLSVPHHANLNLTGDWTIEAWVKLTAYNANSNMYIFWKPGDTDAYLSNYSLEVNPWWGNVFYGYYFSELKNRIGITGSSPTLNEWYHIAFMRDTKKKQIKVVVRDKNRIQISETSATYTDGMTLLNTKDLLLGTGLSGYIDEVRISNIVRTFIKTDIDNPHTNRKAEIYPNPASGSFVLRSLSGNCHINIMSVNGKVLLSKNTEGSVTEAIDISNYEKGIYIVQLIQENRTFTTKLIIK